MVPIDINSVQQIWQKKIPFGHTKRLSKKNHLLCIGAPSKCVFFTHLHIS